MRLAFGPTRFLVSLGCVMGGCRRPIRISGTPSLSKNQRILVTGAGDSFEVLDWLDVYERRYSSLKRPGDKLGIASVRGSSTKTNLGLKVTSGRGRWRARL